eukprot:GHVS01064644.1.p1 GENE.GHVS01064644.1~~GHVS01064644.1.p1  ORF type:complete len:340 (-),score=20.14 GHVS01064644.1:98-1117(-)
MVFFLRGLRQHRLVPTGSRFVTPCNVSCSSCRVQLSSASLLLCRYLSIQPVLSIPLQSAVLRPVVPGQHQYLRTRDGEPTALLFASLLEACCLLQWIDTACHITLFLPPEELVSMEALFALPFFAHRSNARWKGASGQKPNITLLSLDGTLTKTSFRETKSRKENDKAKQDNNVELCGSESPGAMSLPLEGSMLRISDGLGMSVIYVCSKAVRWLVERRNLEEFNILRSLAASVAPLGRIVSAHKFDQVESAVTEVLFKKSVTVAFFNPEALPASCAFNGVFLHYLTESLSCVLGGKVWLPTNPVVEKRILTQFSDTAKDVAGQPAVCPIFWEVVDPPS